MDGPILFGLETEYGFTPLGADGELLDRAAVAAELFAIVREQAPHVPDVAGLGVFVGNGGRLYLDRGLHPEVSTPECSDPREVVRHARAGERLLADAARAFERRHGGRILLSSCPMNYAGPRESWGCHESYLSSVPPSEIATHLVPHLVSRIVYTGGGGFERVRGGLRFLISPRSSQVSPLLWGDRSLLSKRNEPLCRGYARVHLACGESLRSPFATWLKVGTTALVVRLIEAEECGARRVELAEPLAALHTFARDPRCRARVPLASGGEASAVEIQSHYLRAVESQLGRPFVPEWAGEICRAWRAMLSRLAGAPASVATTLEWAIKREVFRHRRARTRAGAACGERRPGTGRRLLAELCETDIRFGDIGGEGLFDRLRSAGSLSPEMESDEPPGDALAAGPPIGRAGLRASLVRRLAGRGERFVCDWEGVVDRDLAVFADLMDPYETEIRWRPIEEGSSEWCQDGLVDAVRERAATRRAAPRPT